MNKYNLIEIFFHNQKDYIDFIIFGKKLTIANNDATCFAELKKESGFQLFKLIWLADGKYIGDYLKCFPASKETLKYLIMVASCWRKD